jgi:tRNA U34 5-methylaminomethyl-2-thiouridine-forming methyltransferase MnmC
MKSQIITTADGSKTIHFPEWNESYHSKHGAFQEANHVYIKSGLAFCLSQNSGKTINILETGFGTGLNTMLSLIFSRENNVNVNYYSIEKYPLEKSTIEDLNYAEFFRNDISLFQKLHQLEWDKLIEVTPNFKLKKIKTDLKTFRSGPVFDLIFFDAFGPRVQPDLWEKQVLKSMYDALNDSGIWVTYSCKGQVKRDLQDLGFQVEKIQGPPGKREMLRAIKTTTLD